MWTFDPVGTKRWSQVLYSTTTKPNERASHACAMHNQNNVLYVHGGDYPMGSLSDLWSFNFNSNSWRLINSGTADQKLTYHTMIHAPQHNCLLTFLGSLNDQSNYQLIYTDSIYQYSFSTASWSLVSTFGKPTGGRDGHAIGYNPSSGLYYVFGGGNFGGVYSMCLYLLILFTSLSF